LLGATRDVLCSSEAIDGLCDFEADLVIDM